VTAQAVGDVSDGVPAFELILEDALPIGILTLGIAKGAPLPGREFDGLHLSDDVLDFCPVGTDVLNGRGPDFSRNEGEVFGSTKAATDGVGDEIIPHFTSTDTQQEVVGGFGNGLDATDSGMEDDAGIVAGEKQVAPSTDVKYGLVGRQLRQDLQQFLLGLIFIEKVGMDVHAEGVMWEEGVVGECFQS